MVNTTNELYHHGVKGMKWGVRRRQKSNERWREKEIAYQKKNINRARTLANVHREKSRLAKKEGVDHLIFSGYSKNTADKAVKAFTAAHDREARWNERVADHLEKYNKRLSTIDLTQSRLKYRQIAHRYLREAAAEANKFDSIDRPNKNAEAYYKAKNTSKNTTIFKG